MHMMAKSYINLLDKLDIRMDGIYDTVKKIHDHRKKQHKDKLHIFYEKFETKEKYFEFVDKVKPRLCDELIEFVILRGIYDLYNWYFTDSIKLLFFNRVSDLYLKIDSDKEIGADIRKRRRLCKHLDDPTPDVGKIEKLFHHLYVETLALIRFNLLMI